jgi:hypothetical protein
VLRQPCEQKHRLKTDPRKSNDARNQNIEWELEI